MRAETVELRESLNAKDGIIRFIVEKSGALVGLSHRGLVQNFFASLNKSVNEFFDACSIRSQLHADASIDGITLRFLEVAALEDGDGSIKSEVVFQPPADLEVIEFQLVFLFRPSFVSLFFPFNFLLVIIV